MDLPKAETKADAAEDYAADAIDFAIAAVQEAEYAILGCRSGALRRRTPAGAR